MPKLGSGAETRVGNRPIDYVTVCCIEVLWVFQGAWREPLHRPRREARIPDTGPVAGPSVVPARHLLVSDRLGAKAGEYPGRQQNRAGAGRCPRFSRAGTSRAESLGAAKLRPTWARGVLPGRRSGAPIRIGAQPEVRTPGQRYLATPICADDRHWNEKNIDRQKTVC